MTKPAERSFLDTFTTLTMIRFLFITILLLHASLIGFAQQDTSKNNSSTIQKSPIDLQESNEMLPVINDTVNSKKDLSSVADKPSGIAPTADLRSVDGLFLGVSYKITSKKRGITPFSSKQKISALKSLKTKAIVFEYEGEWLSVFKNTDITFDGLADIKGNIMNFFGRGNETNFDESGDFRTYYRTNFSFYQLDPALRFHLSKTTSISVGPSFQHFAFNPGDNAERYINTPEIISQFDNLQEDKSHAGLQLTFNWDKRDDTKLPTRGINFSIRIHGYEGLNNFSNAYAQAFPQFSFYKSLDSRGKLVLANRTGAGFTIGETAFYQSAFLGSQDNLLGFRKFRFAGDHLLYNNLELRLAINPFLSKILGDKTGLIGFYDLGRVWIEDDHSKSIHHGYGAGVYVSPFNRFFVRGVLGFSDERMQPTVALRQRF